MGINLKKDHILLFDIEKKAPKENGGIIIAGGYKTDDTYKEGTIQLLGEDVRTEYQIGDTVGYITRESNKITILGTEYIIIKTDSIVYSL